MRSIRFSGIAALAGVLALAATLILVQARDKDSPPEAPDAASAAERPPAEPEPDTDKYGLLSDGYDIVDRSVRRNETFGEILTGHNVPYEKVLAVASSARDVFDVRRIQAGKPLRVYSDSLEGTHQARYVVYEQDRLHYVVFDLAADPDSGAVYAGKREGEIKRRQLSGRIESSLYRTLETRRVPPALVPPLAFALSEVFAWQVDFFRILEGDDFNVIYEALYLDGEPVRVERIVAARFGHRNADYFGFRFDEGDRPDYFDENGNSLRRELLKAPIRYDRISSRYSRRRFHPIQKRYKAHLGTDYAAAPGTPIYSVGDGVVLEAQFKRYNGNYVKIRHNSVYTTGYLHMSRIASGIRPGARVKQGDVIGYVGSTGMATGPHVCYRYWKRGVQIDPFSDVLPPAQAVAPELMDRFILARDEMMPRVLGIAPPYIAHGDDPEDRRPPDEAREPLM